jgi:hypothetical protein
MARKVTDVTMYRRRTDARFEVMRVRVDGKWLCTEHQQFLGAKPEVHGTRVKGSIDAAFTRTVNKLFDRGFGYKPLEMARAEAAEARMEMARAEAAEAHEAQASI